MFILFRRDNNFFVHKNHIKAINIKKTDVYASEIHLIELSNIFILNMHIFFLS